MKNRRETVGESTSGTGVGKVDILGRSDGGDYSDFVYRSSNSGCRVVWTIWGRGRDRDRDRYTGSCR